MTRRRSISRRPGGARAAARKAAATRRLLADVVAALRSADGVAVSSSIDSAGVTRIDRVAFHYARKPTRRPS